MLTHAILRFSARAAALAVACTVFSAELSAQSGSGGLNLPPGVTPSNAAQILAQRPELGNLIRQRLRESGLSPDQVRQRLRAAGYPSNLLDAYIANDSLLPSTLTQNTMSAVQSLGMNNLSIQDSLLIAGDTIAWRFYADSVRAANRVSDSLVSLRRGLRLFGYETFRQPTTQFVPVSSGPVSDGYRLGPGDQLVLLLTGTAEAAFELEVTRDGFIMIPKVGQIFVNSLTIGQLKNLLYGKLASAYSGVSRSPDAPTKFDVTVARVRTQVLRVVGEVARPGSYQISAAGSVVAAVYQAGGLTENSNFRAVEVRRGSQLVATVDLYDFLLHGSSPDVPLATGDVIFVPIRGARVKVAGEVRRPGIYEVKPTESLRDVIGIAGGLTATAVGRTATIDRVLPQADRAAPSELRTVTTVSLNAALQANAAPVPINDGDSVTVFAAAGVRHHAVSIKGNVWQPGTYEVTPGMHLWDLIRTAGGVKPGTYRGRAQVLRMRPDSTLSLLGVTLPDSGASPTADENPELREFDDVTIYETSNFRPKRYIAVYGAVRKPGLVPYADSMSVRDAVLLAGGVQEDGYLVAAEISRLRPGRKSPADSLVSVIRVPLDSTYVVDTTGHLPRPVGASRAPSVLLEPYDNIFIRRQPGWELQRNVVIAGEVQFPGRYSLLSNDERLLSLIQRAGGLTPQAYANGIRFFRGEGEAGRIGVNLPEVLKDPKHPDNVFLAAGDSIYIPRYISTVRVEGAVNSPSSVTYVPGEGVGFYIQAAGGFTRQADGGRTFVQQPNGSVQQGKRPEPGAVVVVPAKDPNARGIDPVALFTGLGSVLASLTTIVIVIIKG